MPQSGDLVTRVLEKFAKGEIPAPPVSSMLGNSGHPVPGEDPPFCESCPCIPCVPPFPDDTGGGQA